MDASTRRNIASLQQIRPYYQFPGADIDRYTLRKDVTERRSSTSPKVAGVAEVERRQTLIAAR